MNFSNKSPSLNEHQHPNMSTFQQAGEFKENFFEFLNKFHTIPAKQLQACFSKNLKFLRSDLKRQFLRKSSDLYSPGSIGINIQLYMYNFNFFIHFKKFLINFDRTSKYAKHYFINKKIAFLWLLTFYEMFTGVKLENLVSSY